MCDVVRNGGMKYIDSLSLLLFKIPVVFEFGIVVVILICKAGR